MDNQNQPNQPAQVPPSSPQNVPPTPPSYQAPQPQPTPSAFQEPPKKKRTGLIIGVILGSIAVIAIIAAILIYFLWWQNPQKVVTDAVVGAISSKQSISEGKIKLKIDSSGINQDINIDLKSSTDAPESMLDANVNWSIKDNSGSIDEINMVLKLSAVTGDDGTMYVKAEDLDKLFDNLADIITDYVAGNISDKEYSPSQQAALKQEAKRQISAEIDPIVSKVDGQWMKLSPTDLNDDKETKCLADAIEEFQKDETAMSEIGAIYRENPFLIVNDNKVESKNGAKGYEIDISRDMTDKAKGFTDEMKNNKHIKKIVDCTDNNSNSSNDDLSSSDDADYSLKVWVDPMSHSLKSAELTIKDDEAEMNLSFDFEIGKSNNIEIPSDARDAKELFKEIEKDLNNISNDSSSSSQLPSNLKIPASTSV